MEKGGGGSAVGALCKGLWKQLSFLFFYNRMIKPQELTAQYFSEH